MEFRTGVGKNGPELYLWVADVHKRYISSAKEHQEKSRPGTQAHLLSQLHLRAVSEALASHNLLFSSIKWGVLDYIRDFSNHFWAMESFKINFMRNLGWKSNKCRDALRQLGEWVQRSVHSPVISGSFRGKLEGTQGFLTAQTENHWTEWNSFQLKHPLWSLSSENWPYLTLNYVKFYSSKSFIGSFLFW